MKDYQRLSKTIKDYQRLSKTIKDYQRLSILLLIFLSLGCSSPTNPTDNHYSTEELIEKLQENPPSLIGCSALSIRGADMIAIKDARISHQQLFAVWSTNRDIGFTPAQLIVAGISITEMLNNNITLPQIYAGGVIISHLLGTGMTIEQLRTGGIPDYILINEACNIPLSVGTPPGPTIRLLSTNLIATNTHVILETKAIDSVRIRWTEPSGANQTGESIQFIRLGNCPSCNSYNNKYKSCLFTR